MDGPFPAEPPRAGRAGARRLRLRLGWVMAGLAALGPAGCGKEGPERVVVSGEVSYQGEPVRAGVIRFHPIKGTRTSMWGAYVVEGKYTTRKGGGVPVGTHRVEILGFRVEGGGQAGVEAPAIDGGLAARPREQYIPPKYNTRTELEVTLEPGQRETVKDFHLGTEGSTPMARLAR